MRYCKNLTRSRQEVIILLNRLVPVMNMKQDCSCQYPSCLIMFPGENDNMS